jgi:hypothetical protein
MTLTFVSWLLNDWGSCNDDAVEGGEERNSEVVGDSDGGSAFFEPPKPSILRIGDGGWSDGFGFGRG